MCVEPEFVEYWDTTGVSGAAYFLSQLRAVVGGERAPEPDNPRVHARYRADHDN